MATDTDDLMTFKMENFFITLNRRAVVPANHHRPTRTSQLTMAKRLQPHNIPWQWRTSSSSAQRKNGDCCSK